jgi:Family of unknown function (DUF5670)
MQDCVRWLRRCFLFCRAQNKQPASSPVRQSHTEDREESINRKESICRREAMLWTIFVILLVLWLLGVVSSYTLGGFIHILLVIALVVLVIQLVTGRRAV